MLERTAKTGFQATLAEKLQRDGFLHLPSVIPAEDVESLTRETREHRSESNFHETPAFADLLEKRQVHRLVQSLFQEQLYYMGWSSALFRDEPGPGVLHDDAKGPPIAVNAPPRNLLNFAARPFDPGAHPTWPVWRLFIYLNDHVNHSGGTKVRRGSHKRYEAGSSRGLRAIRRGKFRKVMFPGIGYVNPPVRPGDAILFNLRCRHSAQFIRWRGPFSNISLPSGVDRAIGSITSSLPGGRAALNLFARPFIEERTSLVVDFSPDSDWARGFQVNRLLTSNNEAYQEQFFDCTRPEFIERLARVGLPILPNENLPRLCQFLRP